MIGRFVYARLLSLFQLDLLKPLHLKPAVTELQLRLGILIPIFELMVVDVYLLVQVLMLRRCLTWLRATWVVRVLPLDQNILLHQIVGYAILCFTLAHTTAHIFNFGTNTHTHAHLFTQSRKQAA